MWRSRVSRTTVMELFFVSRVAVIDTNNNIDTNKTSKNKNCFTIDGREKLIDYEIHKYIEIRIKYIYSQWYYQVIVCSIWSTFCICILFKRLRVHTLEYLNGICTRHNCWIGFEIRTAAFSGIYLTIMSINIYQLVVNISNDIIWKIIRLVYPPR